MDPSSGKLQIPESFRLLLLEFAICFFKKMPEDVLTFSINYFKLLQEKKKQVAGVPFGAGTSSKDIGASREVTVNEDRVTVIDAPDRPTYDDDDDDESDDELPPIPANYQRKSVYTKGYNPDDEDDDEAASEFGKFPKMPEMKKKLEESIKNNLLFRGLEQEQMNTVIDAMKEVPVRVGDEIIKQAKIATFEQTSDENINYYGRGDIRVNQEKAIQPSSDIDVEGDDGDFFYVIDTGIYECFVDDGHGGETMIRTYEQAGCFGELALMYNQPRSATIRAKTNGIVFSLDRNAFQKIVVKSAHERRKLHEELLAKVSLFAGLTDTERQNIADVLETKTFNNNDQIIKEGDEANGMYFVVTGSVKVTKSEGSDENVIKIVNAGEYFGELALLNRKPRAANCYAVGLTKLAFLSSEAFERLMGPCIQILQRHAAQYSKRVSEVIKTSDKNLF